MHWVFMMTVCTYRVYFTHPKTSRVYSYMGITLASWFTFEVLLHYHCHTNNLGIKKTLAGYSTDNMS